jgi:hypothetical protein
MKTPLLFIGAMLSGMINTVAQPVISNVIMPVHGYVMKVHSAQYVNPGPAGINQTWNFSNLVSQSVKNFTSGPASSTPHASSFTAATMQMNDGTNYEFWTVTSTDASSEGIVDSAGVQPNNQGSEKIFKFPLQYGDQDTVMASGFFAWQPFGWSSFMMRTIYTRFEYDGYGTLTTPSGTFSNVARFHIQRDLSTMGNHNGVKLISDEYRWYSNSFHGPLLTVYTHDRAVDTTWTQFSGAKYQQVDPTNFVGISDYKSAPAAVYAYPNPASTVLYIAALEEKLRKVEVSDARGMIVKEISILQQQRVEINIAELPPGIYFVKSFSRDHLIGCQKVVKQ